MKRWKILRGLGVDWVRCPTVLALFVWISLSYCLDPIFALGQEVPDGLTLHRVQAGSPNDQGWYEAQSTEGHFDILFPAPFNDYTVRAKEPNGKEVVTFAIGTRSQEGVKFVASEVPKVDPKADPDLKEFVQSFRKKPGNRISEEKHFEFDGHSAVEFKVTDGTQAAFQRLIKLPNRAHLLIVEYPKDLEEDVEPLVQPFFQSLRFRSK
jgi:hypothetical protein